VLDLIVMGASGPQCPAHLALLFHDRLEPRWPGRVHFGDDRVAAFNLLERMPRAVLAYAPGVFGLAASGQSPVIRTTEPQVILTALAESDRARTVERPDGVRVETDAPFVGTDDPRQFLTAALGVLPALVTLNILLDGHLDTLDTFLRGPVKVAF
jgi:hypothetical protein